MRLRTHLWLSQFLILLYHGIKATQNPKTLILIFQKKNTVHLPYPTPPLYQTLTLVSLATATITSPPCRLHHPHVITIVFLIVFVTSSSSSLLPSASTIAIAITIFVFVFYTHRCLHLRLLQSSSSTSEFADSSGAELTAPTRADSADCAEPSQRCFKRWMYCIFLRCSKKCLSIFWRGFFFKFVCFVMTDSESSGMTT